MKKLVMIGLGVVGGGVGAWLLLKYCKKTKKCGCGCGSDTTSAAGSTSPASSTASTSTPSTTTAATPGILPTAAIAADGKKGWVKQPKNWH